MAMRDVYVRDTEAEGERWIERNREKPQLYRRYFGISVPI
jgi:hypothetical protein